MGPLARARIAASLCGLVAACGCGDSDPDGGVVDGALDAGLACGDEPPLELGLCQRDDGEDCNGICSGLGERLRPLANGDPVRVVLDQRRGWWMIPFAVRAEGLTPSVWRTLEITATDRLTGEPTCSGGTTFVADETGVGEYTYVRCSFLDDVDGDSLIGRSTTVNARLLAGRVPLRCTAVEVVIEGLVDSECGACPPGHGCQPGTCACAECACDTRECGAPSGCPCATCPAGMFCTDELRCEACSCAGRSCGRTECGDSCGECPLAMACDNLSFTCVENDGRCTNICEGAGNGMCEDGGAGSWIARCGLGTDCADCGPR